MTDRRKDRTWFLVWLAITALNCLLFTRAAEASGFYIEGGALAIERYKEAPPHDVYIRTPVENSTSFEYVPAQVPGHWMYDLTEVRNPYGVLSIGYDYDWGDFQFDLQLRHQSSFMVDDHGINSVGFHIRWYPFGKR